jgi:hypothetical protein
VSAIGPGDFIECVDAGPYRGSGGWVVPTLALLVHGAIYQVATLSTHPEYGVPTVCLVGYPSYGEEVGDAIFCGWGLFRFRPIYRPKADLIESLLQGIDQLVPDDSERANARLSSPSPIAGCNPLEKASFIEASGARSGSFKQFRAPEITQPVHRSALLAARLERGEP